ncbi:siderophore-interacting protein [Kitasatospora sp. NPDC048540]|uniref:siderophore-interacting protein n=1 Tax=unclassified Kitasatospora TaxID=2633591 RepID=UPI00053B3CAC|nr:siderophore-interacting protein [Kitasatospora sp. MBT63]
MEQLPVSLIRVTAVNRITPRTTRVTFTAPALAELGEGWPDQQMKLCFPRPGQAGPRLPAAEPDGDVMRWYQAFLAIPEHERPWMRSFTVRARRPHRAEIDVDFVLHGDCGPAGRWAAAAASGDVLGMVGPSAAYARAPRPADWLLLAGDETALPAVAGLAEALPEGARAIAYLEVADRDEEQPFPTRGELTVHWLHRDGVPAGRGTALVDAVRGALLPPGTGSAWLAGEAGTVRALRRHLVGERRLDRRSVEFAGYWRLDLTQDDAPTPEDLAEAGERLADLRADGDAPGVAGA